MLPHDNKSHHNLPYHPLIPPCLINIVQEQINRVQVLDPELEQKVAPNEGYEEDEEF